MQPVSGLAPSARSVRGQRVSVVVVTVDRLEEMRRLLPTLAAQIWAPEEVVVVDAAPSDALEALLRLHLEEAGIPLQYLTSKRGICHQRNRALEACTGDFIFFFDDDVELEADYIEQAMAAFSVKAALPVGGVGGTLLDPLMLPSWRRWLYHLLSMTHMGQGAPAVAYPNGDSRGNEQITAVTEVSRLEGCRMAFRREVFETERFVQYLPGYCRGEDVDFSVRVARKWTLVHTPHARLRHHHSESGRLVGESIVFQRAFARCRFFRIYSSPSPGAWPRFLFGWFGWGLLLGGRVLREARPALIRGWVRGGLQGWRAGAEQESPTGGGAALADEVGR